MDSVLTKEERLIDRIKVDGFKIQFKINGMMQAYSRKVEDISLKGLSFKKVEDDLLIVNNMYEFILSKDNKYISGKAYLVHEDKSVYGLAFQNIFEDHYKILCEFLDPVYAGLNLKIVKNEKTKDSYYLKCQALKSGLFFVYNKTLDHESFEIKFIDKLLKYDSIKGIQIAIITNYKGNLTYINQKNSIYYQTVESMKDIINASSVEEFVKNRIFEILC